MNPTTRHAARAATPNHQNWRSFAACREVDPELFFPIGDNMGFRMQTAEAKRVCAPCPVADFCLQWALENKQDAGVWGGLSEQERQRIHRRRGPGYWARRRNVADDMYQTRRDEFTGLVEDGLAPVEIAAAMETNVQTVNRLMDRLTADQVAEEAMAG